MDERVEMRCMDDPMTMRRVYMFKVYISNHRLLGKYEALFYIMKYLWKVVRCGRKE